MSYFHSSLRPLACALAFLLVGGVAQARPLADVVREAVQRSPLVMEANARVEEADLLIERSKAQRYPTVGVRASSSVVSSSRLRSDTNAALVGRMTLYDFDARKAEVERDENRREFFQYKKEETKEQTAYEVSSSYLQALRFRDLAAAEQENLRRHKAVESDLQIIAGIDKGRRYELTQAQARVLAVQNRIVQSEKAMRLALTKLRKYGVEVTPEELENPFLVTALDQAQSLAKVDDHPSVQAQVYESEAVKSELKARKSSEKPRIVLESSLNDRLKNDTRVLLEWNFFDRSNSYYTESFTKQYASAQARTDVIRDDIRERSLSAQMDYEQSSRQVEAAERQIQTSKEVVDLYTKQFKIARRSLIELLNAYGELSTVEVSKVTAQNDQRAAVLEWMYANAHVLQWAQSDHSTIPTEQVAEVMKVLSDGLNLRMETVLGMVATGQLDADTWTDLGVGEEPLLLKSSDFLQL